MPLKYLNLLLISLFGTLALAQDVSDEEVVTLDPFCVTSEYDQGYSANRTLGGSRVRTELKDVSASLNVVTAEFLRDSGAAIPQVPVTLVKKADALVIQFAIATTADKAETRNAELHGYIENIAKAVQALPGVRFEPREVFLASADRKTSLIGKGGVVTSYAHFVIFADIAEGIRPYQRVKQMRDLIAGLKIDSATTKLIDGPAGLFIRRPSQYRGELLTKIFDDLNTVRKGLGEEVEILPSGLNGAVRMRACSESEIELWIDYSFTIRSVRELDAKKK